MGIEPSKTEQYIPPITRQVKYMPCKWFSCYRAAVKGDWKYLIDIHGSMKAIPAQKPGTGLYLDMFSGKLLLKEMYRNILKRYNEVRKSPNCAKWRKKGRDELYKYQAKKSVPLTRKGRGY